MGDLLRALLTRVDRDSVSLDTELSTLRAFLDVVAPDTTISAANEVRDVIVPAMLLTALASAMDQLASVDIQSNDGALEVHLHATSGSFDERQLAQIRERVRRRYDDAGTVTVDRLAEGGFDVKLQLPIEQSAVLEDDELILQPAVGVA
jgi:hypothetical protein